MTRILFAITPVCLLSFAFARTSRAADPPLRTAPGFAVERIYSVPRDSQGSWVSLCSDSHGVLYASDQYGPLHRIELPSSADGSAKVRALNLPIGGVHGMVFSRGEMFAIVGQKEICAPGLYRLRDTNGAGELNEVTLLRELGGDGEHGPHALAASPDGSSLYVIAGNAAPLPQGARSRVPELWREDSLLAPLPALMGSETHGRPHGGWIARTDRAGRDWEIMCLGLRNSYALACDRAGELFTFDSDTEMEIGLPWYRPTRVLHVVSGADFGWRKGALKIPDSAPDLAPALLPMGPGSPTAVLTGEGASFPGKYRDAIFVADWSFGRLYAIHLRASGAGFTAEREPIVTGAPLPIAAACVNPRDGAIYFVTGGRKTESALYRLRWKENLPPSSESPVSIGEAARQRRALEEFHGRSDARAVETAWPFLGSKDVSIRNAARTAIESQPLAEWRDRALHESEPRAALAALLALARAGDATTQTRLLDAPAELDRQIPDALRPEWLRVLSLGFTRGGHPDDATRKRWLALLEEHFPFGNRVLDVPCCELLIHLRSPRVAAQAMALLRAAPSREEQLDYLRCLRVLDTGWTPELRGEFYDWLGRASAWRGGGSFTLFVQRLRRDALAAAPENERAMWEQRIAAATPPPGTPAFSLPAGRGFVKAWKLDELVAIAGRDNTRGDARRGRQWYSSVGCAACHSFAGEGGVLGPDLTSVAGRFSTHDLLEAITDPSKEISDQYGSVILTRHDGTQLRGLIVNHTADTVHFSENLYDPSSITKIPTGEVRSIEISKVSLMPEGLLNVLEAGEILDLLAYLQSGLAQGARKGLDLPLQEGSK
jgi:putative heme-binding domain-containing protein